MSQRAQNVAMDLKEARARLEASDKLYYRIGEVSKLTGVKAHVLRYWETEFRWMAPPKSRSKQRLYRKRDIEFVWLLKHLLWNERYTIAGARRRIQELGVEEALESLWRNGDAADGKASRGARASDADEAASSKSIAARATSVPDETWGRIHAALEEMHGDLIALRGVLQESG